LWKVRGPAVRHEVVVGHEIPVKPIVFDEA
jgi:hypothetical protein